VIVRPVVDPQVFLGVELLVGQEELARRGRRGAAAFFLGPATQAYQVSPPQ